MRLSRLALRNYGNFGAAELRFDPAPGRINLVLAPNGAGKSVLRGAFGDLLFGIGAQTPMSFRHGYTGMQVAAEGVGPDGAPFHLIRRKGRANTLLGPDEAPLDPGLLPRLLGGADRALLERLFALDTERLREGGQGLLASGGALAEALLEAAGGLRHAQALRAELEAARNAIAPERKAAQRPFYAALERLAESRRALKAGTVRPERWLERERALSEARARRDAAQREAAEAAAELRRLERVRRLRPVLARHDAAAAWLAAHPDALRPPPGLRERLAAARQAVARSREALAEARRRAAELGGQAEAVQLDEALLARAGEVAALLEAATLAEKARREVPEVEASLRDRQAQVEARLRSLGLGWSAARASEAVPSPALLARARRLAHEHARHAESLAAAPRAIAAQEAALREAEAALAALPPARDSEALATLLAAISAEGDPGRLAAAAARAVVQAAARLEGITARLPAAWRAPAALRDLAPPEAAVLARAAAARSAAREAQQSAQARSHQLEAALADARARQAALGREGPLPDAEALAAARTRRDAGWALIYRRAFGGTPEPEAEAEYGAGQPLSLAFAAALAEADRIADLRAAEADRLGAAERLAREIAEMVTALETARGAEASARSALDAAEAGWAALLAPLSLDPAASLAEVEELLARRLSALEAWTELEAARAAEAETAARHADAARRILRALGEPECDAVELRALLDRAEAAQRDARRAEAERDRLALRRDAARAALAEARLALAEAERGQAAWHGAWAETLAALGRPPDEAPEDCEATLRVLEELGPLVREMEALAARAATLSEEIAAFAATAGTLPGGEAGADPFSTARALGERLRLETAAASRRALLLQQAAEAREAAAGAEQSLKAAETALAEAVAEAGAADAEAAEARLALAAEREAREAARDEALAEALAGADGLSLAQLREEADAVPADGIEAALAAAREAQAAHHAAALEAAEAAAHAEAELKGLGDDEALARAAQEQQAAIARIGQSLEDALLLHLAGSLLGAAMGRVQEAGDDRMLRRVGAAFSALTEGAYPAVTSREDDRGVAHLLVRRRDVPEEETGVEALSEGTRDQLFLALRLVAIEDHVAGGTPLPFLGDDILQSFDDGRSAAAFRTLLAFSETTQVILLTHHDHLAELARAALPPGTLHLQRFAA